jgi:hypothetical protein
VLGRQQIDREKGTEPILDIREQKIDPVQRGSIVHLSLYLDDPRTRCRLACNASAGDFGAYAVHGATGAVLGSNKCSHVGPEVAKVGAAARSAAGRNLTASRRHRDRGLIGNAPVGTRRLMPMSALRKGRAKLKMFALSAVFGGSLVRIVRLHDIERPICRQPSSFNAVFCIFDSCRWMLRRLAGWVRLPPARRTWLSSSASKWPRARARSPLAPIRLFTLPPERAVATVDRARSRKPLWYRSIRCHASKRFWRTSPPSRNTVTTTFTFDAAHAFRRGQCPRAAQQLGDGHCPDPAAAPPASPDPRIASRSGAITKRGATQPGCFQVSKFRGRLERPAKL